MAVIFCCHFCLCFQKDDTEAAGSKLLSRTDPLAEDSGESALGDAPAGWTAGARKRTQTLPNRRCFLNAPPNPGNQSMDGKDVSRYDICSSSSSASSQVQAKPVPSVGGHRRTSSQGLFRLLNLPRASNSDDTQRTLEENKEEAQLSEGPLPQRSGHLGESSGASETPSPELNGGIAPHPPAATEDSDLEDPDVLRKMIAELKKEMETQKKDYETQLKRYVTPNSAAVFPATCLDPEISLTLPGNSSGQASILLRSSACGMGPRSLASAECR